MKHYLLLFITLFTAHMVWAGPVDQDAAHEKAANFVAAKMGTKQTRQLAPVKSAAQKAPGKNASQRDYFHVFNIDGGGFVIVSGDDRTEEILGYSITGTYDADNMPDNMRAFMQSYMDGIDYLDRNNVQVTHQPNRAPAKAAKSSIAPLLKTTWDQWAPYSLYCPRASDGTLTLTGCVATAMAQVMAYHKWPAQTTKEIPAYSTSTNSYSVAATPAGTTIDWTNIKDSYTTYSNASFTEDQADDSQKAVARLMQLCGQSVKMNYGTDMSGSNTRLCMSALIDYFDYEESTLRWVERTDYSYSEWQDLIYGELQAARPVLYDGFRFKSGHAFVCDGYDSDDFFHINWGYSGSSNGYFRLRLLNPSEPGAVDSSTNDGYGTAQSAGIGIQKNDGVATPVPKYLSITNLEYTPQDYTRSDGTNNFSLNGIFLYYSPYYGFDTSYDIGARILDSNGQIVEDIVLRSDMSITFGGMMSLFFSLGASYADATYKMVFISRESGSSDWYVSNRCFLSFTINGNTLTLNDVSPKITIESSIDGLMTAKEDHTITFTFTNNGTSSFRSNIYYSVNGGDKYPAGAIDMESGQTDKVVIKYIPEDEGSYSVQLYIGTTEFGDPFTFTIGAEQPAATLEVADVSYSPPIVNNEYVNGTTVTMTLTLKNTSESNYSGKIFTYYYTRDDSNQRNRYSSTLQPLTLAAGTTGTVDVVIDYNASYGDVAYYSYIYYTSRGENKYLTASPTFKFHPEADPNTPVPYLTINELSYEPKMQYDTNTSLYYIDAASATFSAIVKNKGTGDYNGVLRIQKRYHNASTGAWTSFSDETENQTVTIAANGGTKLLSTTWEPKKNSNDDFDYYRIRFRYKEDGATSFITLAETPSFIFRGHTPTPADAVTVTAKSYTIKYGDALPAFEYTSEGATLNGTPAISCEATSASPVGTYPIVITKGSVTNYNDSYVNGTLTITKAPLTVTAENATREQGEENPTFTITYNGWKNSETEAVLTTKPTATTTATKDSEPGEYAITVSGGEAQNYELSYVNGVLTITAGTGILGISAEHPVDVYDLHGNKIRTQATSLSGLPKGVYVVNGRKLVVK